jgi:hypothetical protein
MNNTTAEGFANLVNGDAEQNSKRTDTGPKKPTLIWPEENEQTRNMSFCELYRIAPGPHIQWEFDRVLELSKEKQKKWWQELYEWWRKGKPDHKTRLRKSSEGFPAPARKEAFHGILGEIIKIVTDGSELKPQGGTCSVLSRLWQYSGQRSVQIPRVEARIKYQYRHHRDHVRWSKGRLFASRSKPSLCSRPMVR